MMHRILAWAVICLCASACSTLFPDDDEADKPPSVADTATSDSAGQADAGVQADAGARPVPCPTGSAANAVMPKPDACPAQELEWFKGSTPPAPTLKLESGVWDPIKEVFTPWQDGEWAPVHWGMRLGAGVWTALRVHLPGETADKVKLEVNVPGLIGCVVVGATIPKTADFLAVKGEPGVYVHGDKQHPGACILLAYNQAEIDAMCNEWMIIPAAVRVPGTDTWGEVVHVVRLYLDSNATP